MAKRLTLLVTSDIHVLNLRSKKWSFHENNQPISKNHSAVDIGDGKILTYGGFYQYEFAINELISNSKSTSYCLDQSVGKLADDRISHACCVSPDGSKIFISGGRTIFYKDEMLSDLQYYDLNSKVWKCLGEFVQRYDHTIYCHGGKVYAFGGFDSKKGLQRVQRVEWFDLNSNEVGYCSESPEQVSDQIYCFTDVNGYKIGLLLGNKMFDAVVIEGNISNEALEIQKLSLKLMFERVYDTKSKALEGTVWHHSFHYEGKLYFLGSKNEQLTEIIEIDLRKMGLVGFSDMDELADDIGKMQISNQELNFEIFGLEGSVLVNKDRLARKWKFFSKLICSGMKESKESKLYLPEPIKIVQVLVNFLLDGKILNYEVVTIEEVFQLINLSKLYEISELYEWCLQVVYEKICNRNIIKLWRLSNEIGDDVLVLTTSMFIYGNWVDVTECRQFQRLKKHELIKLAQQSPQRLVGFVRSNTTGLPVPPDSFVE